MNGKIASVTDYGAFIELEPGVEGLVHVSEMTWSKRMKHPSKLVQPGENVEVEVLGVDPKNRRISLGMKQTQPNPRSEEHTSELQSRQYLVCRLLLEKKIE